MSNGTGPDYARIKAALANSRVQTSNNALYQCIYNLIDGVKKFQDLVLNMFAGTAFGDLIQNIVAAIDNIELTGDVTGGPSPSPVATVISNDAVTTPKIINDAVTYAKMQNVSAASRLLGRGSAAGAGDVQEITLGTGLTMSGTSLSSLAVDFVVMSDGANPANPLNDGNGNFIYTPYTP